MLAIQRYLPNPRHTETHRIFVKASPADAWQAARNFDGADIPWVRLLFAFRELASTSAHAHTLGARTPISINAIATNNDAGFKVLYENPGKEVVVGAIGQFWHLDIPFADIPENGFADFNEKGWGKVAWAITVEPYFDGATIAFELRTTATDDLAWEKLGLYYDIIGIASKLIRSSVMSHLEADLGTIKRNWDEMDLPGDDIFSDSKFSITHATLIEAPASMVWRYLMQLGCDRGGWYSIDALDNGGKPSIDHIEPQWKPRQIGDHLAATPTMDNFFVVLNIQPPNYMILGGTTVRMGEPFRSSWTFLLEPVGDNAVCLVTRARMETSPKWKEWLLGGVILPPVHHLMQKVQLHNLKKYAERDAQNYAPATMSA